MKSVDEDVVSMCRAHEGGDVEAVRKLLNARPELEHRLKQLQNATQAVAS
jgi:hypothetical protein